MSDGEATGGEGSDGGRKNKKIKLTIKGQSPTGSRAGSPAPGKAGSVGGSRAGSPAALQSMQSISQLFGGSGFKHGLEGV
jgi:transcription initiation factor TFIIF subunit alpha